MTSKNKPVTLSESDISSERSMDRRSILGSIGLGVGAAAAAVLGATTAASAADAEGRGRRCAFRDRDRGDSVRRACGLTDND